VSYGPQSKPIAFVDDRRMDYDRSLERSIHEPRVPPGETSTLRADDVHVLHLQWLLPQRTQFRQAWYRCREWLDQERTAAALNERYVATLPRGRRADAELPASGPGASPFRTSPSTASRRGASVTSSSGSTRTRLSSRTAGDLAPAPRWSRRSGGTRAGVRNRIDRGRPSWPTRAMQVGAVAAARRRLSG
jgi:hypothetical protein